MKLDPTIFRAYDIRGVYGKNLTDEIMEKMGMAVGTVWPGTYTVGRDFREHGKSLQDAFVSGLIKTGSNAVLVGQSPTGVCVFGNWMLKNDFSAFVTASHLTAEWNGLKLFDKDGVGFFEEDNAKIRDTIISGKFKQSDKQGEVKTAEQIESEYIDFIVSKIKPDNDNIKVVIDFGNGAASLTVQKLIKKMNINADFMFATPDANFPNRDPEPSPVTLDALRQRVVETGADLGIAYDGDGDRMMFVDDLGRVVMSEQASVVFLRDILKHDPQPDGFKTIVNVECSSVLDEEVKRSGGEIIRIPVGHTFLVQEAKRQNAIYAIEKSGHVCIPKFFWFDDAIISSIYMIEIVSKLGRKLSEVLDEIPARPYKRFKFMCSDSDKFKVVEKVKDRIIEDYKSEYESVTAIDGVRVDFPNAWILIRASNTSPKIRLTVEAENEQKIEELGKRFSKVVDSEIERVKTLTGSQ